jgi:hypothetical protein
MAFGAGSSAPSFSMKCRAGLSSSGSVGAPCEMKSAGIDIVDSSKYYVRHEIASSPCFSQ